MVSGQEVARVIIKWIWMCSRTNKKEKSNQRTRCATHEQVRSQQNILAKHVTAFCAFVEDMGNPFIEECEDYFDIGHTWYCWQKGSWNRKIDVTSIGKQQFQQFVKERLESNSKSFYEPIKQYKLLLFRRQQPIIPTVSKEKQQITSLKQNCSLFSQFRVKFEMAIL